MFAVSKLLVATTLLCAVSCSELRLGFPLRGRGLVDDLGEILDLLPIDEIRAIVREFTAADAEVQDVVRYLQGPNWASLIARVASDPSWISFKEFADANGISVDNIVDTIHDLINGLEVPDVGGDAGGVRSMLDNIRAIIPTNELLVLLDDKLQNSEAFQEFFGVISSPEAREFVNRLLVDPEVMYIGQALREFGVDVDLIIETIKDFLGWTRYTSPDVAIEYL